MGPLVVEFADEGIEPGLLLKAVCARRPGRLGLEGAVHALVAAVLLRVAGPDAFDRDAEPQPEDRQLRQVVEAVGRGEGQAVIGADRRRQAALPKQAYESLDDRNLLGRFEGLAQEDHARGLVGHRQGVTVLAVAELELALESLPSGLTRGSAHHRSLGITACDSGVPSALQRRL